MKRLKCFCHSYPSLTRVALLLAVLSSRPSFPSCSLHLPSGSSPLTPVLPHVLSQGFLSFLRLCLFLAWGALPSFLLLEARLGSTPPLVRTLGFLYLHPCAGFVLQGIGCMSAGLLLSVCPSPHTNHHRNCIPSPKLSSPADLHPSLTQTYKTKLAGVTYSDKQASRSC